MARNWLPSGPALMLMLRGGAGEPAQCGGFVLGDAVAVEQQLAEQRLGVGHPGFGERAEGGGALLRRAGEAGCDVVGGK